MDFLSTTTIRDAECNHCMDCVVDCPKPNVLTLRGPRWRFSHPMYASMLVLGLARDDFSLIGAGLSDRLHQDRRAHLYPRSMELIARAEEVGAVGATISGAGPTVLFWCHWQQTGQVFEALKTEAADCDVRRVQFVPGGADVSAL